MLREQDKKKIQAFLNDLQAHDGAMLKKRLFETYALNTFEELLILVTGRTKPDIIFFMQGTVRNAHFEGSADESGNALLTMLEDWL